MKYTLTRIDPDAPVERYPRNSARPSMIHWRSKRPAAS
jgi:hypothetical protein